MKKKIFYLLSWATILAALTLLSIVLFWILCINCNPIDFKNQPSKVLNKTVKSGGYLTYELDFCKYKDITPQVTKYFVDGILYEIPAAQAVKTEIGCHTQNIQVYIPKALPPGEYKIKSTYVYQINPLKKITKFTETETFTVTVNGK